MNAFGRIRERERDPVTWCYPCNSFKHKCLRMWMRSVLTFLGSYGFHENADRMTESIHKNRIYSIARNATEFVNFRWIKEGLSLNSNRDMKLVYGNIKTQKDGLNMNPACSVLLTTQILKHTWTCGDFRPLHLTTWTHELTGCESHFMRILPFHLRKLASYHTVYTQKLHGNLSK